MRKQQICNCFKVRSAYAVLYSIISHGTIKSFKCNIANRGGLYDKLKQESEANRSKGIAMADEICRKYRREIYNIDDLKEIYQQKHVEGGGMDE